MRGDGGVLKNSEGKRFMFDYIPTVFKGQYAETEEEADQWLKDNDSARRTPDLLPRDEVARAINAEVKAGRGTPHGGVYLDIASRMPAEEIKRRLPSMYHQFIELAEVDITKDAMEVGPTCHYVMGGIEVDPDTGGGGDSPGCSPPVSAPAACTAPTGSAATRCPTCWCSAGAPASAPRTTCGRCPPGRRCREDAVDARPSWRWPRSRPDERKPPENPYTLHAELQESMNDLVRHHPQGGGGRGGAGQARRAAGRYANVEVEGHRQFNPGWHLAIDMRNMLLVSECVAKAALQRTESRGGHTRDDHPEMDANGATRCWCAGPAGGDRRRARRDRHPRGAGSDAARPAGLFELSELEKYYTDDELAEHPDGEG